eukprot:Clim_evm31s206 gene=Clim_evmTU31s206
MVARAPDSLQVKELNDRPGEKRFRFKSFSERVASIHVTAAQIERPRDNLGDDDTYFLENLEKWRDLNLTRNFAEFGNKVMPLVQSLPQLLYHKDKVATLLSEHLRLDPGLAVKELGDLCVQFVRDLRDEAYENFADLLEGLMTALNPKDPEAMNNVFHSIAYIFKYLIHQLVEHFDEVLEQFQGMLHHDSPYVRRFGAESFAVLLRRSTTKQWIRTLDVLIQFADGKTEGEREEWHEVSASIVFEVMKGVKGGFHSKAQARFQGFCGAEQRNNYAAVRKLLLIKLLDYTESTKECPDLLSEFFKAEDSSLTADDCLVYWEKASRSWAAVDHAVAAVTKNLLQKNASTNQDLAVALLSRAGSHLSSLKAEGLSVLLPSLNAQGCASLLDVAITSIGDQSDVMTDYFTQCMTHYASSEEKKVQVSMAMCLSRISSTLDTSAIPMNLKETLIQYLRTGDGEEFNWHRLMMLYATMKTCGRDDKRVQKIVSRQLKAVDFSDVDKRLANGDTPDLDYIALLIEVSTDSKLVESTLTKVFVHLIATQYAHAGIAYAVAKHHSKNTPADVTLSLGVAKVMLLSPLWHAKMAGIGLLRILPKDTLIARYAESSAVHEMLEEMTGVLELPIDLTTYRERLIHLERLEKLCISSASNHAAKQAIMAFMTGLLFNNFAFVSKAAVKHLGLIAKGDSEIFWETIAPFLETVADLSLQKPKAEVSSIDESYEDDDEMSDHALVTPTKGTESGEDTTIGDLGRSLILPQNHKEDLDNSSYGERRVDYVLAFCNCWSVFAECPESSEKHSRLIVPSFMLFIEKEYQALFRDLTDHEDLTDSFNYKSSGMSREIANRKLRTILKTLTSFHNAAVLYCHDEIKAFVIELLTRGIPDIQLLALDVLIKSFRRKALRPHHDLFKSLLGKDFKDVLLVNDLRSDSGLIRKDHREEFMDVYMRLILSILSARKGKTRGGHGMQKRRAMVISRLANLEEADLKILIDLMCQPIETQLCETLEDLNPCHVPPNRRQIGFLNLVRDLVKRIPANLNFVAERLIKLVLHLASMAHVLTKDAYPNLTNLAISELRRVRNAAFDAVQGISQHMISSLLEQQAAFESFLDVCVFPGLPQLQYNVAQDPSALMRFLLTTFSDSDMLKAMMTRNDTVLLSVTGCLSAPDISSTIATRIMQGLEQLIDQARAEESNDNYAKKVLKDHTANLISSLEAYMQTKKLSGGRDLRNARDELRLLSKLGEVVPDLKHNTTVLELLMPFLKLDDRVVTPQEKSKVLQIVRNGIEALPKETTTFHYPYLCQHFATFRQPDLRVLMAQTLQRWGESGLESLPLVAPILVDLNAMDRRRVNEPDFEKRLAAFSKIGKVGKAFTQDQWLPIVHHCLYVLQHEEDLALRSHGLSALQQMIQHAFAGAEELNDNDLILRVVWPSMKRYFSSMRKITHYFEDYVRLLQTLVKEFGSKNTTFKAFAVLHSEDDETAILDNITHIQVHRRIRTVGRIGELARNGDLHSNVSQQFVLPYLLTNVLQDTQHKDHNLLTRCLESVELICPTLPSNVYMRYVRQYVELAESGKGDHKNCIRVVVSLLQGYSGALESESTVHAFDTNVIPRVSKFLVFRGKKDTSEVRPQVAASVTHLLITLPVGILQKYLNGVLNKVCHILRSPMQSVRDETRQTLVTMMLMLGPQYMPSLIDTLESSLNKGHWLHIRGFTLHAVLSGMQEISEPGDYDDCIEKIIELIFFDIFGIVSEEKAVAQIGNKSKEAKKSRGYDAMQLTMQRASKESLGKAITPVRNLLSEVGRTGEVRKVKEVLRVMTLGLQKNPALNEFDLLVLSYQLMQLHSMTIIDLKQRTSAEKETAPDSVENRHIVAEQPKKLMERSQRDDHLRMNAHLLVDFALALLLSQLRAENQLVPSNEEAISRLDPFAETCYQLLRSRHDALVVLSLKNIRQLLRFPLPSLHRLRPLIIDSCIALVRKMGPANAASDLVQGAVAVLTSTFKDTRYEEAKLSDQQIKLLLEYCLVGITDISDQSNYNASFALFKGLIAQRVMLPEIYDAIDKVSNLMIQSSIPRIRQQAVESFIAFLVNYPLADKRMERHVHFLIKNLEYEEATGREAVLEALNSVVIRFPTEILEQFFDILLLPLLLRILTDTHARVREMSAALMGKLLLTVPSKYDSTVAMISKWLSAGQLTLRIAAAKLMATLLQHNVGSAQKSAIELLPEFMTAAEELLKASGAVTQSGGFENPSNTGINPDSDSAADASAPWYYLYCLVGNILQTLAPVQPLNHRAWTVVGQSFSFPHQWVMLASLRVLNQSVTSILQESTLPKPPVGIKERIRSPPCCAYFNGDLFRLASVHMTMLTRTTFTDSQLEEVVAGLFDIGSLCIIKESMEGGTATTANGSANRTEANNDEQEDAKSSAQKDPARWFFKKLTGLGRLEMAKKPKLFFTRVTALSCALRYFRLLDDVKAMNAANQHTAPLKKKRRRGDGPVATEEEPSKPPHAPLLVNIQPSNAALLVILELAVRIRNSPPLHGDEGVRQLVEEVLAEAKRVYGTDEFATAYMHANRGANELKEQRKSQHALDAVVRPEIAAKRRQSKQQQKKEAKKRRIQEHKKLRG